MGQKVNPHGLRVGIIKDWDSKWYVDNKISVMFSLKITTSENSSRRRLLLQGVSKIEIEKEFQTSLKSQSTLQSQVL